jgi:O-antigen biosynthesis protein WbqV
LVLGRRVTPFVKNCAVLLFEAAAGALALYLAVNFAFGRGPTLVVLQNPGRIGLYAVIFGIIAGSMAYVHALHRGIWRFTSLFDFIRILRSATLTVLLFLPVVFLSTRAESLPRSAPIIAWFLAVALSGAPRIGARVWGDRKSPMPHILRGRSPVAANEVPVVLVGSAVRIETFLRALGRGARLPYAVVGILTYERAWHGRQIHGYHVFGGRDDLARALAFLRQRNIRPQRLLIADDNADEGVISQFLEEANTHGLTLARLPRLLDFFDPLSISQWVRPIALADLLGRPQVVLDREAIRTLIAGRRVLITGAGGSIGSELVRQISDLQPSRLVLLENSEFNLYSIEKELSERHPDLSRRDALCDVRDRATLDLWFRMEAPDIVFHAAALKHVPLVESHPVQGVRTNVLGTQNVADACVRHKVGTMVLISTDKAVNPHNVMGACKRCAEAYCQAFDAAGSATRFFAVRFGNVLGSAGSVVPLFQRQLAAGGPITVTHPDITRYFMTIPEAVALVLQASALGTRENVPRGAVFVLDMGKPIRIADLARQLIRLSGKRPDIDVKIAFVGLRPGEKLHEELVHAEEQLSTAADGVMMVTPRTFRLEVLKQQFTALARAAQRHDEKLVLRLLMAMVPEFAHADDHADTPIALGRRRTSRLPRPMRTAPARLPILEKAPPPVLTPQEIQQ